MPAPLGHCLKTERGPPSKRAAFSHMRQGRSQTLTSPPLAGLLRTRAPGAGSARYLLTAVTCRTVGGGPFPSVGLFAECARGSQVVRRH